MSVYVHTAENRPFYHESHLTSANLVCHSSRVCEASITYTRVHTCMNIRRTLVLQPVRVPQSARTEPFIRALSARHGARRAQAEGVEASRTRGHVFKLKYAMYLFTNMYVHVSFCPQVPTYLHVFVGRCASMVIHMTVEYVDARGCVRWYLHVICGDASKYVTRLDLLLVGSRLVSSSLQWSEPCPLYV